MLLSIPFAVYHDLEKAPDCGTKIYCRDAWPSRAAEQAATIYVVAVTYVIPLALIVTCYTCILRHLWRKNSLSHRRQQPLQVRRFGRRFYGGTAYSSAIL